jgi:very-short-patch-repair endonuclease
MAKPRARFLRRNKTEAERKLWASLRRRQVEGFRFRQQHPLGPFVVDSICLSAKLIVEIDGGGHEMRRREDDERSLWLESRDYCVLRFWNRDVLQNTPGVVGEILDALRRREHPPPRPPPQGGRE